jgi:molybdopterin molybdotransferase
MLSATAASDLILDLVQPLVGPANQEWVGLAGAGGRVLAVDISGECDFPAWDNSAMDGYAVRWADIQNCDAQTPAWLDVAMIIPAGTAPKASLEAGQAARLYTGSMLPVGADTVIPQEDVVREGERVKISTAPSVGTFVRHQGDYYQAGGRLLSAGSPINAPELAVLATAQCTQVPVCRRPVVALFSTGSELVAPDQPLQPGQIVDSNQLALAHLITQAGAEVKRIERVSDQPESLQAAIADALTWADVIVSSGGVSVGDYDYVDQVLAKLGATLHIRAVAVKPGKPLTVATCQAQEKSVLYFGLPGNPVSAFVTFWRFVHPALRKLSGLNRGWEPTFIKAISQQPLQGDRRRETYAWGQICFTANQPEFSPAIGRQNSANLINLANTNALAVLPAEQMMTETGERVTVMLLG